MPKEPRGVSDFFVDIPNVRVNFDPESLDEEIRNQGVRLVHYSAIRCPVGLTDIDDNRRPHDDHEGCSNGFLYEREGTITALLTGNGKQENLQDAGYVHGASFTATFPRQYDMACGPMSGQSFYVAPFDRFYLEEEAIVVPTWQLVRCNESGVDKLNFPAVRVLRLKDQRGQVYREGEDFDLKQGQIVWRPARRPVGDPETDRDAIISVRYLYRPFWYCGRLLHEIRVSQVENLMDDRRPLVRMPQQALLNREWLYLNESNDPEALKPSNRQAPAPTDGGFGPR